MYWPRKVGVMPRVPFQRWNRFVKTRKQPTLNMTAKPDSKSRPPQPPRRPIAAGANADRPASRAEDWIIAIDRSDATLDISQRHRDGREATVYQIDNTPEALKKALTDGLAKHQATVKDARDHMTAGRQAGVDWQTEIPDTDPGPSGAGRRGGPPPR